MYWIIEKVKREHLCVKCKKKLELGQYRITYIWRGGYKDHFVEGHYCLDCGLAKYKDEIDGIKQETNAVRKLRDVETGRYNAIKKRVEMLKRKEVKVKENETS